MATIPTSVLIDRTSLSLSALELNDAAAGMKVVAIAPGSEEYDLSEEAGGSADGDDVTHMRRTSSDVILVVRFSRSTTAALWTLIGTAKTALRQQAYGISGTINSQAFSWSRCWPRRFDPAGIDGSAGGQIDRFGYVAAPFQQAFMFTIRRRGTISGPF